MKVYDKKLDECKSVNEVVKTLDEIGLKDDIEVRLKYLYDFMGVLSVFETGDFTMEDRYELAKEDLIEGHWRYFK